MARTWDELSPQEAKDVLLGYSRRNIGSNSDQMPLSAWEAWVSLFGLGKDPEVSKKALELNPPSRIRKERLT